MPEPDERHRLARELDALRSGVGWARLATDRIDLAGPDRVRFLHNLVTCEVRELVAGRVARGFFTNLKGGVLSPVDVVELGDRYRLVLPRERGAAIRAHLERYRILERVELVDRTDLVALALRGERATELLASTGTEAPPAAERREVELAGRPIGVRREARGGEPRLELELAEDAHDLVVAELRRAGAKLGLVELSAATLDCARIEDGELAFGVDYGEENFPQETGEAEETISFTKGCYLGQEVVARIHYRGGVQRVPRGLRFDGEAPALGTPILKDGREAGCVTSAARSPRFGVIGVALVHRRAGEPPAAIELAGGAFARLAALPFSTSSGAPA